MNRIVLSEKNRNNLAEIESWCKEHVGKGSMRYRANTWMGTDDWFCYEDVPPPRDEDAEEVEVDVYDDVVFPIIFVFRREEDSVMFAIKWA